MKGLNRVSGQVNLNGALYVYGYFLEGVIRVSGGCPESAFILSERCMAGRRLEDIWRMYERFEQVKSSKGIFIKPPTNQTAANLFL